MLRRLFALSLLFGLVVPLSNAAAAEELRSTLADQQEVAVTIYNEDLALIKDKRRLVLGKGPNTLAFREVSGRLRPETALLKSVSHPGKLAVVEQNFDFDLLTPEKMLEKYVGEEVQVVRTNPASGEESVENATVLAAANGTVLRIGDRIETQVPGRLIFPNVPAHLRDRPTLVMELESATAEAQEVELSYLSGGLGWKADYVAELDADDKKLDMNGWVTLTNTSGATYKNARLQLMAGDVNVVREMIEPRRKFMAEDTVALAGAPAMAEEQLFEYHLYTLPRPTTIRENQTKQVALLAAAGVPCKKEFLLRGAEYYYQGQHGELGRKLKVGVFLELANRKENNLGLPLPKGVVRVYKKDAAGAVQFVGEDAIDHTPENETVRLKLGDAFDVTADRTQTDFRKLAGTGRFDYVFESAYRIELRNAKEEKVTVRVLEPMPGDWQIVEESHEHAKESASAASWQVVVPAKGEAELTYRVRVRF